MEKELKLEARGKINLTLDILGKREDGFHEVRMIMQSIGLSDTVILRLKEAGGIVVKGDVPGVLKPEDNLMYRAAKLFADYFKIDLHCEMELVKRIPVAAGLAGGSADAGAVFLGLKELLGIQCHKEELLALGAKLGSDIPFTMEGGTMLATGRGEILTPCKSKLQAGIVLVKPKVSISTPWAYGLYAKYAARIKHPDEQGMLTALADGNLARVQKYLANVFQDIMLEEVPAIKEVKDCFARLGHNSLMSGSGPTVFALVENLNVAEELAVQVAELLPEYTVVASELV